MPGSPLQDHPPFLEPLLGMWLRLSQAPFTGITTDGLVREGLFKLQGNGAPTSAAAAAASRWLASLSPPQRAIGQRPLDASERRHWQNTPLVLHRQLEFDQLTHAQRNGALEILRQSLSLEGYARVIAVMENNELLGRLAELETLLNRRAFTLTIFGEPSTSEPWGWQFFGHHLALNTLFLADQMAITPVFLGVEPATPDPQTQRTLFQGHEERALAFMKSLSGPERRRAVLYDSMLTAHQPPGRFHPDDGRQVGGAFQDNRIVPYEGVAVAGLTSAQRRSLLDLAQLFLANLPAQPEAASLRTLEAHLDETHFAWIGQANDTDPFYFRIHSPVALLEFDHHSGIFLANRDPQRFHVHTIVRTPNGGDYGLNLLRQHYTESVHKHAPPHLRGVGAPAHSHNGGASWHVHD